MIGVFRAAITAAQLKQEARRLGADLVGVADGANLEQFPPDPDDARRPSDITEHDGQRVIVLAKKLSAGVTRILPWGDRHKFYNDELVLSQLESISLDLVYWLEDRGYPAIIVPPTHVDPWRYEGDPRQHQTTLLSLPHAAVEAGLGTLGLNLQLLTAEYGPRVLLTAVLTSAPLECDSRKIDPLCLGPACGRCLQACPADAVQHWARDWDACDTHRSPYGFAKLTEHVEHLLTTTDVQQRKELLRSETMFNLWQSILRGAGAITGCRRCADVCPVGADYGPMLKDALDAIPESTSAKSQRLDEMRAAEARGEPGESHSKQQRWVGEFKSIPIVLS